MLAMPTLSATQSTVGPCVIGSRYLREDARHGELGGAEHECACVFTCRSTLAATLVLADSVVRHRVGQQRLRAARQLAQKAIARMPTRASRSAALASCASVAATPCTRPRRRSVHRCRPRRRARPLPRSSRRASRSSHKQTQAHRRRSETASPDGISRSVDADSGARAVLVVDDGGRIGEAKEHAVKERLERNRAHCVARKHHRSRRRSPAAPSRVSRRRDRAIRTLVANEQHHWKSPPRASLKHQSGHETSPVH
jgi:hypothetical protein